jgi:hypothetical protein
VVHCFSLHPAEYAGGISFKKAHGVQLLT